MKKFYTYMKNAGLALLIASTFGCGKEENKVVYINEVPIGEENNLIKSQEDQENKAEKEVKSHNEQDLKELEKKISELENKIEKYKIDAKKFVAWYDFTKAKETYEKAIETSENLINLIKNNESLEKYEKLKKEIEDELKKIEIHKTHLKAIGEKNYNFDCAECKNLIEKYKDLFEK